MFPFPQYLIMRTKKSRRDYVTPTIKITRKIGKFVSVNDNFEDVKCRCTIYYYSAYIFEALEHFQHRKY